MKERPIIFSAPMVRAILDGRKTQTRRVIKGIGVAPGIGEIYKGSDDAGELVKECQHGTVGDMLWVRETWADVNSECGPAILYRADSTMQNWRDFCKEFGPDYGAGPSMNYEKYPGDYLMWWTDLLSRDNHKEDGYVWKSPIHMPRWASRITLEITSLRVERVQEISESDAIAEGVDRSIIPDIKLPKASSLGSLPAIYRDNVEIYAALFESLNGAGSWDKNPWVWVIEFKRI